MRLALAALFALAVPAVAQEHIAKSDPKTPADEKKSFKLPPGFEAQLVASEPDIGKPIQMAFDAKGRLWVTTSYHYPFAADKGKASDKLYVLSDFGSDGKAKKVQVFVIPAPGLEDGKKKILLSKPAGDGSGLTGKMLPGGIAWYAKNATQARQDMIDALAG